MKGLIISSLVFFFLSAGFLRAQEVKSLTTSEFRKEIWDFKKEKSFKYSGDKPIILDLYATWCPPCKKLSPILANIQKEYGNKLQIYKIDVDKEPELAGLFEASSIPTMVFIPQTGHPFKIVGLRPQEQLEQIITEKLEVKK